MIDQILLCLKPEHVDEGFFQIRVFGRSAELRCVEKREVDIEERPLLPFPILRPRNQVFWQVLLSDVLEKSLIRVDAGGNKLGCRLNRSVI